MDNSLEIFNDIAKKLLAVEKQQPVAEYISSDELFDKLDLSLSEEPIDAVRFKNALQDLILNTPRTATHGFFNQLFGGRNEKAVLGELLAVMLNNSMYTYKAAGAQVGIEKVLISELCNIIGWDKNAGGTFALGGSMTNFMSMLMARDSYNINIKNEGIGQEVLTVYTSIESHYSIAKNASFSGIGRANVQNIATDKFGRISITDLRNTIEHDIEIGKKPILVNLTAGTTVLGAFDPIEEIAYLCKKHNIWLHLDGAYCGSVIFSNKYKDLIKGVSLVDSFSLNAHKMIGTPLTCSLILVKDKLNLLDSFSNEADYLYQSDKDEFNLGKTSLQCGRRNDALKFWTLWKSIGSNGLETIVNKQFELANIARNYIKNNEDYSFYGLENSISVCFNYKDIPAKHLCTQLYHKSQLLVGYGSFQGDEFVRLVTINSQNEQEDILNFFKTIEEFVEVNIKEDMTELSL